jgi:hypothetical protein
MFFFLYCRISSYYLTPDNTKTNSWGAQSDRSSGGTRIFCQGGLILPKKFIILQSIENENMPLPPKIAIEHQQVYKVL